MKTLKITALVLGLSGLLAGTTSLVRAQDYQNDYRDDGYSNGGNVSMQTFYDELSPYGTWIQDPQYGYVWRPDVDQNEFRPYYTNGRWAMTEYGNTWVSNYDWGWAPFHYGRWVINSYRQWIWLPDTNWGPAWVDWRSGDGYYGWAPMAPSISINLSFGRRYSVPEYCWNFIPQSNIYINVFPRYNYARNNVYIRNTTIINNTYVYNRRTYYGGPRIEDIRRATNRDVRVYRFDQSSRPGASRIDNRQVSIYRPRPERNADNRNAAPKRFEQGNAGFNRNGRNGSNDGRESRVGDNNSRDNNNRFGQRNDNRVGRTDGTINNRSDNTAGDRGTYTRDANGRPDRIGQNGNDANQRNREALERGNDQRIQRNDQAQQQRNQQLDQQRTQRNQQIEQAQQQRNQQMEQQRTQRDAQMQQQRNQQADQQRAQMEQQRVQRDAQAQQQRAQQADQQRAQMDQQRAQRDAQAQQQRAQQADQQRAQMEQQRAQRDAQAQQQRQQQQQQQQQRIERPARTESAPPQQNRGGGERSSEGGRPSRGGRG